MAKKIFLITEFHHSSQNSTGYLIEKLYHTLLNQKDFETILITKKDESIDFQPNVIYIQQGWYEKSKLINRLSHEITLNFKFLIKALKNISEKDLVITGTNPTLLLFILFTLKKYIKFDWVLLVHDVFPENLVASKTLTNKSFLYKISKTVFDKIYASPDSIITIGQDMQSLINKKAKRTDAYIVPNWIDVDDVEINSRNNNLILEKLGLENSNRVIFNFFGNIGRVQGLDNLFESIEQMEESNNAQFVFIGDGAYVDKLKILISKSKVNNIVYYGKIEQNKKSIGLNACDIAIVTLADGMLGLGVPSKAYYSMAADKPLFCIMDKDSEIYMMVEKNNIGWVVEPNDTKKVAQKLDQAVKDFRNIGLNSPRQVLLDKYSDKSSMNKLISIIRTYI